jgi:hypothetical protein
LGRKKEDEAVSQFSGGGTKSEANQFGMKAQGLVLGLRKINKWF